MDDLADRVDGALDVVGIRRSAEAEAQGRAGFLTAPPEGLQHVGALSALQFLDVSETTVTDSGLQHIDALERLRVLNVRDTGVTEVGAICFQNDSLEPYSSRGPTIDARIKPDIAGQDAVTSGVYGAFSTCGSSGFTGTSAASPHTAGAAALAKQVNPSLTASQLRSFLQGRAGELGAAGADNLFGAGKLPEIGEGLGRGIRNFRKSVKAPDEIDVTPQNEKEAESDREGAPPKQS